MKKRINSPFAQKCRGCKRPLPLKTVEDDQGRQHVKPDLDWPCLFCTSLICGWCYIEHTENKHGEKYTITSG